MPRISRPSPAMIVALLALFIALGGTGYAVTKLPKNSVGREQIKNDAVDGGKVENYTLKARDFAPGQLPAGPQGATGPSGTANAVVRYKTEPLAARQSANVYAICEEGERVIAGGGKIDLVGQLLGSGPVAFGQGEKAFGWFASADNDTEANTNHTAYAICASP